MTTKIVRTTFGIGFLLIMLLGTGGAGDGAATPAYFGGDIVVEYTQGSMFTCHGSLVNLATNDILFEPSITSRMGEEATASAEFVIDGITYAVDLRISADGPSARYELEVVTGGETVYATQASLVPAGGVTP